MKARATKSKVEEETKKIRLKKEDAMDRKNWSIAVY